MEVWEVFQKPRKKSSYMMNLETDSWYSTSQRKRPLNIEKKIHNTPLLRRSEYHYNPSLPRFLLDCVTKQQTDFPVLGDYSSHDRSYLQGCSKNPGHEEEGKGCLGPRTKWGRPSCHIQNCALQPQPTTVLRWREYSFALG